MSHNVSSSVLFHLTNTMENLKSILSEGFHPRYCPEYGIGPTDTKAAMEGLMPKAAAPIICFCDLPLALISKHVHEYGQFGIGLPKLP